MTILVIGDSISYGAELSDLPAQPAGILGNDFWDPVLLESHTRPASQLAWPALLGQRFRRPVENLSLIGGSNARIHRLSVSLAARKKYDLIICAWTHITRIDVSWRGQECPVTVTSTHWPWVKSYFADHWQLEQELERQMTYLLSLQSFFHQQQQPYLFVNAAGWYEGSTRARELHPAIDRQHYALWRSDLLTECHRAQVPFGPQGHFLEQGHQLAADLVEDFVITGKILGHHDDADPVYSS
jgi:hypothetical protein